MRRKRRPTHGHDPLLDAIGALHRACEVYMKAYPKTDAGWMVQREFAKRDGMEIISLLERALGKPEPGTRLQ